MTASVVSRSKFVTTKIFAIAKAGATTAPNVSTLRATRSRTSTGSGLPGALGSAIVLSANRDRNLDGWPISRPVRTVTSCSIDAGNRTGRSSRHTCGRGHSRGSANDHRRAAPGHRRVAAPARRSGRDPGRSAACGDQPVRRAGGRKGAGGALLRRGGGARHEGRGGEGDRAAAARFPRRARRGAGAVVLARGGRGHRVVPPRGLRVPGPAAGLTRPDPDPAEPAPGTPPGSGPTARSG